MTNLRNEEQVSCWVGKRQVAVNKGQAYRSTGKGKEVGTAGGLGVSSLYVT